MFQNVRCPINTCTAYRPYFNIICHTFQRCRYAYGNAKFSWNHFYGYSILLSTTELFWYTFMTYSRAKGYVMYKASTTNPVSDKQCWLFKEHGHSFPLEDIGFGEFWTSTPRSQLEQGCALPRKIEGTGILMIMLSLLEYVLWCLVYVIASLNL